MKTNHPKAEAAKYAKEKFYVAMFFGKHFEGFINGGSAPTPVVTAPSTRPVVLKR